MPTRPDPRNDDPQAHAPEPGQAHAVDAARAAFPRGLSQPRTGQGFRFGTDSLLLAAFAGPKPKERMLDLGCGCGVIGLACLLHSPDASLVGLDQDPLMLEHARQNAKRLGLWERADFQAADLRQHAETRAALEGPFSLVLANPPYRLAASGRQSRSRDKRLACFDADDVLGDFLKVAAASLGASGRMCLSGLTERLPGLLCALPSVGLTPKRLRFLHGHAGRCAKIVLVEAKPGARAGLMVEPPFLGDAG